MFRYVTIQLLLFHAMQGVIDCSEPTGLLSSLPTGSNVQKNIGYVKHNELHKALGARDLAENNERETVISQQRRTSPHLSGPLLSPKRQRRHIGSIAAFRGLPALPYNRFNSHEWSTSTNPERIKFADGVIPNFSLASLSKESESSPLKRYTETSSTQDRQELSAQYEKGMIADRIHPSHETIALPSNEARTRAVSRLLRFFSENRVNPKHVGTISKKFIGALARHNALPPPTKQLSSIQYRGSLAIPLPGKRATEDPIMSSSQNNGESLMSEYYEDDMGEDLPIYKDI